MPDDKPDPGGPRDWLRYARSDLALARSRKTRYVLYQHLCFHAQQAAEKSLKAVLIALGKPCPRTHDLAYLLDSLPANVRVPPSLIDLPTLTKYAVQQRYPGEISILRRQHLLLAIQLAEDAVAWADGQVDPGH